MKLTSADVIHSFWVPQLAGKTDLLPNRVNEMWIDPQKHRALRRPMRAVLRSCNTRRCCCACMSISRSSFSSGSPNNRRRKRDCGPIARVNRS